MNISSNEPLFYPYINFVNKGSGNGNDINKPYTKLFFPDVAKYMNIKVFNLMLRTNETRHVNWDETCPGKCRLDASVCQDKHLSNSDKCRSECKELIEKGRWDDVFVFES